MLISRARRSRAIAWRIRHAERAQQFPAPDIPQLDRVVEASGSQAVSTGTESDGKNLIGVARECAQKLTGRDIPQFHRVVAAARRKPSWWGILFIVPVVQVIVPGYLAWAD